MKTLNEVMKYLDLEIEKREKCIKGFKNNPVNIKQKRSIEKMNIQIVLMQKIKDNIAERKN